MMITSDNMTKNTKSPPPLKKGERGVHASTYFPNKKSFLQTCITLISLILILLYLSHTPFFLPFLLMPLKFLV